ncbi:MAG: alkaline phosphatase D family protein [Luteolibacter sp.]
MNYRIPFFFALSIFLSFDCSAQHDGHREAVIDLTHGRSELARERLEKLFKEPGSLWRGQKGPYARVGKTLVEKGDGYRTLVVPETHYTLAIYHSLQGDSAQALVHARAAVAGGVPIERIIAGPREGFEVLHESPEFKRWTADHPVRLIHGPMLGHVTHEAASFWLRTATEADVEIRVMAEGAGELRSAAGRTSAANDFTTVVRVDGLMADAVHRYRVLIDGEDVEIPKKIFRTHPEAGEASKFQVAFTACAGYAPEHERVWRTIGDQDPLALLMLGDNVYIDDPEHSLTQRFCYYRRFSRPEWRELVGGRGVYSIWDDHDFGIDDSFGGPATHEPAWKVDVWKIFTENWNNPSYGGGFARPGVWFDFHIGDVHFIMLDGRYYREANGRFPKAHPAQSEHPSMLGAAQLEWLKETLRKSQSTFRVIASPVPWAEGSTEGHNKLDKWDGFLAERNAIFDFLHEHEINGVVLISGDRHRSDARRIDRENGYALYDFMSAIPTNYHTHPLVDGPGMLFGHNENNTFAMLRFDTTVEDPEVIFEIVDIDGKSIWSHRLRLSQLHY